MKKKNVTTIVKMNIAAVRGILYWLVKLITVFLTFQKAIQTFFIGVANSTFHFDKFLKQNCRFCKNQCCTEIDVDLNSDVL